MYDVRPLNFERADEHTASDLVRCRLGEAVTRMVAIADQERGEVDWETLQVTVERHTHDGALVLRSSARLRS
jgi:hypothetical protein